MSERSKRVTFMCGSGCHVEVEDEESANAADAATHEWAGAVEREIRALTGFALMFPDIDRQAAYWQSCYDANERRRAMRGAVTTNLQMTLFGSSRGVPFAIDSARTAVPPKESTEGQ